MAEKKRSQKAKKKGVLLPDVPETAAPSVGEEETSEQKRRADRGHRHEAQPPMHCLLFHVFLLHDHFGHSILA